LSLPTFAQAIADRDEASFHPGEMILLASFNRRVVIDLPGVDVNIVGKHGYELASKRALIGLIQGRLAALGLQDCPDSKLPEGLNEGLDCADSACRAAAKEVADEFGRRLGYLLASVLLSPRGYTSPMVGWEKAYLNHWRRQVKHVVLGGGLASGSLGRRLCAATSGVLQICGLRQPVLEVAAHPAALPLVGAARSIPPGDWQVAAVADFGGSLAKRALARYAADGALSRLQVLPPVPIAHLTLEGKTPDLAQAMIDLMADAIRCAGPEAALAPYVVGSVAGYVQDGRPTQYADFNMGIYSWLNALSEDLPAWFSQRISAASGRQVRFEFAHDGDAAAVALAGRPHTAVIMLGSALGIGITPAGEGFRQLAPDFRVISAGGDLTLD
jgi:hypothetical protein